LYEADICNHRAFYCRPKRKRRMTRESCHSDTLHLVISTEVEKSLPNGATAGQCGERAQEIKRHNVARFLGKLRNDKELSVLKCSTPLNHSVVPKAHRALLRCTSLRMTKGKNAQNDRDNEMQDDKCRNYPRILFFNTSSKFTP
jgi:hypothetical protein